MKMNDDRRTEQGNTICPLPFYGEGIKKRKNLGSKTGRKNLGSKTEVELCASDSRNGQQMLCRPVQT
jgi:hypothetical protein